ncbi:MAG: hypothetical protein K8R87_06575 [Verrucomicrobia bacterium]|nr:hypothetical protein [Verrucomicrobiota bacterium]
MPHLDVKFLTMRTLMLIATVFILDGCGGDADHPKSKILTFPVNREPVEVENSFAKDNPFYKQRAGAFYDTKYVSYSAAQLFDLARVRPDQMTGTLDSMRAFVYDWLDFYVRGGGKITDDQRQECVSRMDERFKALLDEKQFKLYQKWRDDTSGKLNTLEFLINQGPKTGLPDEPKPKAN